MGSFLPFSYDPNATIICTEANGKDQVDHAISFLIGTLDVYLKVNNNNAQLGIISNDGFAQQTALLSNKIGRCCSVFETDNKGAFCSNEFVEKISLFVSDGKSKIGLPSK